MAGSGDLSNPPEELTALVATPLALLSFHVGGRFGVTEGRGTPGGRTGRPNEPLCLRGAAE